MSLYIIILLDDSIFFFSAWAREQISNIKSTKLENNKFENITSGIQGLTEAEIENGIPCFGASNLGTQTKKGLKNFVLILQLI